MSYIYIGKFHLNFDEVTEKAEDGYPGMFLDLAIRCAAYEAKVCIAYISYVHILISACTTLYPIG